MIDDTYALLRWLEDLSLTAHNDAAQCVHELCKHGYTREKEAYERVIAYVKTMGKPAQPYRHENQAGRTDDK